MKINHTPKETQPFLFRPQYSGSISSDGELRTRMGARIEDVVCRALKITPIKISNHCKVNFDAGIYYRGKEIFFEIKSLKKHNSSPLYDFRLKKDVEAVNQCGVPLIYVFCVHNLKSCRSQKDITQGLLNSPIQINLLSLDQVIELTDILPIRGIKSEKGRGYSREGYADGYKNLSQKIISSVCEHSVNRHVKIGENRKKVSIRLSSDLDIDIPKWMRGKR